MDKSKRIVYAIGDNVISSLGTSTRTNITNITAGISGIKSHTEDYLYPQPVIASLFNDSIFHLYPYDKNLTKLENIICISVKDAVSQTYVDLTSDKTIFIFSSTKGNIDLIANGQENKNAELTELGKTITKYFGAKHKPYFISNACISGVLAIILGERLIKSGAYDNAVLIGADMCSEFAISGFMSFKSVSPNPCKPFDKDRDGLSMGEGVATLILSKDSSLSKNRMPIKIAGGSSSNDANHISAPSRTGLELCLAMQDAMKEAGLKPEDIDMVNCHGTATLYNDEMEAKAISLAGLANVPVVSFKGYIGHTLGASGLMESIFSIKSIYHKRLLKTLGFETLGVPVEINVSKENKYTSIHNVIKTASGFGGCNAAIVLSDKVCGEEFSYSNDYTVMKHCLIANKKVEIDGKTVFDGSDCEDFGDFIRTAFKNISEPYLRFGKMDNLCKLGITAAEYLLKDEDLLSKYSEREIAVVLYNQYSSLDTDRNYQKLIDNKDDYQPSPKIFVYTLANIVTGEISLKHHFKGENLFLISDEEKEDKAFETASMIMTNGRAKVCLTGKIEFYKNNYIADLYLITK